MDSESQTFALCSEPPDPQWREQFASALDSCDWWISAEWAGVEDDDEAAAIVEPLTDCAPQMEGPDVVVDFGEAGALRISTIDAREIAELCAAHRGPDDDCTHGYRFTLRGGDALRRRILEEAVQAIAIGMAGAAGWVFVPRGAWWDIADGSWME